MDIDLAVLPAVKTTCSRARTAARCPHHTNTPGSFVTGPGSTPLSSPITAIKRTIWAGPAGATTPYSAKWPRRALMVWVRCHQQVPGPERHCSSLLRLGLRGDKAHGRSQRRFRNRLGIGRIVLLPLHERLHIPRRDQPDLMTQRSDHTPSGALPRRLPSPLCSAVAMRKTLEPGHARACAEKPPTHQLPRRAPETRS